MDSNKNSNKIGPIAGGLVVIILIVIAGFYFFQQKLSKDAVKDESTMIEETKLDNDTKVSTSNDSAVIEADLNAELKDVDYSF